MNDSNSLDENVKAALDILKLINRLMYALLGAALFCLVVLFGPDASIIAADARLEIPVVDQEVSVRGFLFFGPFILISLNLYIHLYLSSIYKLPENIKDKCSLYIFTMKHRGAQLFTGFVFYWLIPMVLAVFVWKALPRPEIGYIICATISFTVATACLQICRSYCKGSKILYLSVCFIATTALIILFWWQNESVYTVLHSYRSLDLIKANLENRDLRNVDLRDAHMEKANLISADLQNARLTGAYLQSAQLHNANLRGTKLDGRARLHKAELQGADLQKASLNNALMAEANLEGAMLQGADLCNVDLAKANLKNAKLGNAKMKDATLVLANLSGANLNSAILEGTSFLMADLTHTKSKLAILHGAELYKAKFSDSELIWAGLQGADLRQAILDRSNLYGADLSRANLSQASLKQVNFHKAILVEANFEGADLSDADLLEADLSGALGLTCAQLKTALNWRTAKRDKKYTCDSAFPLDQNNATPDNQSMREE